MGLAIPNIVMQPTLDEVQQVVNKAVQMVVGVSKGVMQWSKERKSKVSFFFSKSFAKFYFFYLFWVGRKYRFKIPT